MIHQMNSFFDQYFGKEGLNQLDKRHYFFSPGRVNLIGEHIDYNGGMVLPAAISLGTYAIVSERQDRQVSMVSMNFEAQGLITFDLDHIEYTPSADWGNYPMGVFLEIMKTYGPLKRGYNIVFNGDLPNGAGLSSSASLEVLTAVILDELNQLNMDRSKMALLCQHSENEFNGVKCGIMDQFSIAQGRANSAILLDCNTLAFEVVPALLQDYRLMIINSNKKRGLVDSAYNERRAECEKALKIIKEAEDAKEAEDVKERDVSQAVHTLCDLTPVDFLKVEHLLTETPVYKRAYHAICENERTKLSQKALAEGNLMQFGQLMYASHESLKHQFEVSCYELDVIVEASRSVKGVIGARMTGAGFGGCAIALVHKDEIDAFEKILGPLYHEKTGLEASFYVAKISGGAGRIK